METNDLKNLWAELDQRVTQNWQLNLTVVRALKLNQVQQKMSSLHWLKGIAVSLAAVMFFLLVQYVVNHWGSIPQVIAGAVVAIWMLAVGITTLHELVLLQRVNYAGPIPLVQQQLVQIKLLLIKYLRLGVWMLPLYFAFTILFFDLLWGVNIVADGSVGWLWGNLLVSMIFVLVAYWLHHQLVPENAEKRWMNALLGGNGSQITAGLSLLEEIAQFEKTMDS